MAQSGSSQGHYRSPRIKLPILHQAPSIGDA
jgi:hypothetical protein